MTAAQRNYMDKLPEEIQDIIYLEAFRCHHKNMLEELGDTWYKFNPCASELTIEWQQPYNPSQFHSESHTTRRELLRNGPYYNYNSDDLDWWDDI